MVTYKSIEELPLWQEAISLGVKVYQITLNNKLAKDFVFKDQLRKTALSISSNIAEGFERNSKKEFIQFLFISRGSLGELRSQLVFAYKLGYISKDIFEELNNSCLSLSKKIVGFIKYLKHKNLSKLLILFLICNLQFVICNLVFSAFQNTDWSVRAESMGGVFTAISDEPSGMYYNPAGISAVSKNCVQAMYSKPYLGLEDVNFSLMNLTAVIPVKYIRLGIGTNVYDVQGGLYRETLGMVSIASSLSEIYQILPPVKIGLNLKYLNKKYSYDDEILQVEPELQGNDSKSVFSVDLGVLYKILGNKLSFGIALKDINQPDIAVLKGNKDIVPMTVSFGSAYNFGDVKAGLYFEDLTVAIEARYRNQEWGDDTTKIFYAVGFETYLNFHTIGLRFGIGKNLVSLGFGYYGIQITEGINLGLNYAFGLSTVYSDNLGNHRVAVEVKF